MDQAEPVSRIDLEDLPYEITQAILSHLPLAELIPISLLSPTLRSIALSPHITPFLEPVHRILLRGPPYPPELATLGCYTHISRSVFLEILVRGEARWILEEMEIPKLPDRVWEEVCKRRFLPSWKRYREDGERWRSVFLRMLRRLEHRGLGCTHEESWTRFLMLHRNGSCSLNRIYSRTFDPLEIFREIKLQNNVEHLPTEARLLVQLQDVRILMFGVLAPPRSVFTNDKAFRLCHPPRLAGVDGKGGWETIIEDDGYGPVNGSRGDVVDRPATRRNSEATMLNSGTSTGDSRSRSFSVSESTTPGVSRRPWNMTTAQVFAPLSSSNRLNSSVQMLQSHPAASRDSPAVAGPGPSSSQSRTRSGSGSTLTRMLKFGSSSSGGSSGQQGNPSHSAPQSASSSSSRNWLRRIGSRDSQEGRTSSEDQKVQGGLEEVPEGVDMIPAPDATTTDPVNIPDLSDLSLTGRKGKGRTTKTAETTNHHSASTTLPYSIMSHPVPAPSHALYPNYTPEGYVQRSTDEVWTLDPIRMGQDDEDGDVDRERQEENEWMTEGELPKTPSSPHGRDTRMDHPILREKRWLYGVVKDGGKVVPSEWVVRHPTRGSLGGTDAKPGSGGEALTWVGPVLLIAQLHPAHPRFTSTGHPHLPTPSWTTDGPCTSTPDGSGPCIDLGPRGMYVGFDFEDLEVVGSWIGVGGGVKGDGLGREGEEDGVVGLEGGQEGSAWGGMGGRREGLGFGR